MALTRDFKETLLACVRANPKFRNALRKERIEREERQLQKAGA